MLSQNFSWHVSVKEKIFFFFCIISTVSLADPASAFDKEWRDKEADWFTLSFRALSTSSFISNWNSKKVFHAFLLTKINDGNLSPTKADIRS